TVYLAHTLFAVMKKRRALGWLLAFFLGGQLIVDKLCDWLTSYLLPNNFTGGKFQNSLSPPFPIPFPKAQPDVDAPIADVREFSARAGRNAFWENETERAITKNGGYAQIVDHDNGRPVTRIEKLLRSVKAEGGGVARVWLFRDMRDMDELFETVNGVPVRMRPEVFEVTRAMLDAQRRTGVKILPSLFDFHILNSVRSETRGTPSGLLTTPVGEHPEFFTAIGRDRMLDLFRPWMKEFAAQFDLIDLFNEPDNVRPALTSGVAYNPHVMLFLQTFAALAHEHGGKITVGVDKMGRLHRYQMIIRPDLGDVYSVHLYGYKPGQLPPAGSLGVGTAPIWITEIGASTPEEVAAFTREAKEKGYRGILFWPQDGFTHEGYGQTLRDMEQTESVAGPSLTDQPGVSASPPLSLGTNLFGRLLAAIRLMGETRPPATRAPPTRTAERGSARITALLFLSGLTLAAFILAGHLPASFADLGHISLSPLTVSASGILLGGFLVLLVRFLRMTKPDAAYITPRAGRNYWKHKFLALAFGFFLIFGPFSAGVAAPTPTPSSDNAAVAAQLEKLPRLSAKPQVSLGDINEKLTALSKISMPTIRGNLMFLDHVVDVLQALSQDGALQKKLIKTDPAHLGRIFYSMERMSAEWDKQIFIHVHQAPAAEKDEARRKARQILVDDFYAKHFQPLLSFWEQWHQENDKYHHLSCLLGRSLAYAVNMGAPYADSLTDAQLQKLLQDPQVVMGLYWNLDTPKHNDLVNPAASPTHPFTQALRRQIGPEWQEFLLKAIPATNQQVAAITNGETDIMDYGNDIFALLEEAEKLPKDRPLAELFLKKAVLNVSLTDFLRRRMTPEQWNDPQKRVQLINNARGLLAMMSAFVGPEYVAKTGEVSAFASYPAITFGSSHRYAIDLSRIGHEAVHQLDRAMWFILNDPSMNDYWAWGFGDHTLNIPSRFDRYLLKNFYPPPLTPLVDVPLLASEMETSHVLEFVARKNNKTIADVLADVRKRSPEAVAQDLLRWVRDENIAEVEYVVNQQVGISAAYGRRANSDFTDPSSVFEIPKVVKRTTTLKSLYQHRLQNILAGMRLAQESSSPQEAYLAIMRKIYEQPKNMTYAEFVNAIGTANTQDVRDLLSKHFKDRNYTYEKLIKDVASRTHPLGKKVVEIGMGRDTVGVEGQIDRSGAGYMLAGLIYAIAGNDHAKAEELQRNLSHFETLLHAFDGLELPKVSANNVSPDPEQPFYRTAPPYVAGQAAHLTAPAHGVSASSYKGRSQTAQVRRLYTPQKVPSRHAQTKVPSSWNAALVVGGLVLAFGLFKFGWPALFSLLLMPGRLWYVLMARPGWPTLTPSMQAEFKNKLQATLGSRFGRVEIFDFPGETRSTLSLLKSPYAQLTPLAYVTPSAAEGEGDILYLHRSVAFALSDYNDKTSTPNVLLRSLTRAVAETVLLHELSQHGRRESAGILAQFGWGRKLRPFVSPKLFLARLIVNLADVPQLVWARVGALRPIKTP
ncbi:MAG TPA: hypothetical protein P5079_08125, partial [Elusimicrobiota bacterium]|nr:hypothetical protein [Elusimicrobiota bacterium]